MVRDRLIKSMGVVVIFAMVATTFHFATSNVEDWETSNNIRRQLDVSHQPLNDMSHQSRNLVGRAYNSALKTGKLYNPNAFKRIFSRRYANRMVDRAELLHDKIADNVEGEEQDARHLVVSNQPLDDLSRQAVTIAQRAYDGIINHGEAEVGSKEFERKLTNRIERRMRKRGEGLRQKMEEQHLDVEGFD